jgi:hypothetical protein
MLMTNITLSIQVVRIQVLLSADPSLSHMGAEYWVSRGDSFYNKKISSASVWDGLVCFLSIPVVI